MILLQQELNRWLFYCGRQRIVNDHKVSFLIIDEFDAFYHHDLSTIIVEELKKSGVQFVLTTHNTSVMTNDLLRPDCYFLMKKNSIKSLAKLTNKELKRRLIILKKCIKQDLSMS